MFISECTNQSNPDATTALVVLDWSGGVNPIYPNHYLEGLDLSAFPVEEGGTLADDAEVFQELVADAINKIYCQWPDADVAVRIGEYEENEPYADTILHLTQELRPDGGMDIGQGEYDPCDRQDDNVALIFGERIRELSSVYTFDEWVNVFANVCAHEIAHTLGYGHILREDRSDTERSAFVELMLDRHTMAEMRRPHRFVAEQSNCTIQPIAGPRTVSGSTIVCTHTARND